MKRLDEYEQIRRRIIEITSRLGEKPDMVRREIDQDISMLIKFDRNCNLLEMDFITARHFRGELMRNSS
jgi:hypothetical protein